MYLLVNRFLPFKGFIAMNICGILFVRKELENKLTDDVLRHETIHSKQMLEILVIGFYLWYLVEWLFRFLCCFNFKQAYRNIGFEREAKAFEDKEYYLEVRRHFAWMDFI